MSLRNLLLHRRFIFKDLLGNFIVCKTVRARVVNRNHELTLGFLGELIMKLLSIATLLLLSIVIGAGQSPKTSSLEELRFLIGEWEGVGGGGPGSGKGVFSFAFDLQNKAIVRKNYAEYQSTPTRPTVRHDDLMIIYLDRASNQILANYFDSEGQQITYKVTPVSDEAAIFLSESSTSQPHFRLSYRKLKDGALSGKFEVAPPGQPEAFKTYLEWSARKR